MKNWENLRFYLEVARRGTVLSAAEHLGISHATVIRRIGELEEELGGSLFKRSQQGYKLTRLGERLLEHAVSIERETKSIESLAREESQCLEGRIIISCPESDMVNVFPVINEFLAAYPGITIELNTTLVPVDLNKKDVDIAIRMTNDPPENLVGRKVGNVDWGIFASSGYLDKGANIEELSELDWIIWRQKHFVVGQSWLQEHVGDVRPILDTNKPSEVLNAIKSDLGVGMVSHEVAEKHDLVCLVPKFRQFGLWVLTHPDSKGVERISAFMSFIAHYYQSELAGKIKPKLKDTAR